MNYKAFHKLFKDLTFIESDTFALDSHEYTNNNDIMTNINIYIYTYYILTIK